MGWKSLPQWFAVSLLFNGLLGMWIYFDRSSVQIVPTLSQYAWDPNQSLAAWSPALPDLSTTASPETQVAIGRRHSLSYEGWVALLSREAAALAANPPQKLSVLAGDSISLWFPADLLPPDQSWLNQGISGETTEGLERRINAFDQLQPQNIFVMIGINDLLRGASPQDVLREYERLIYSLKRHHPHSDIILQSILPHGGEASTWEGRDRLLRLPNATIANLNTQLKTLAETEGIYYLDLWPVFINAEGTLRSHLTTDGLHLNANGYMVWSTALQLFTEWKQQQAELNPNLANQQPSLRSLWQKHLNLANNLNRDFP
jgi:lysophospholipase L1-like esterase